MEFQNASLNSILRQQFPKGIGLRERKIGRQRLVEINFASAAERDQALMKPFNIQNQPIKVSKTLDKNADVVRIGISEIPHEQEDFLKYRLIELFSKYGEILRFIEDGLWSNGRGFTLNREKTKQFLELEPQIPSWEEGHFLRLNWNTMKLICTYCHVDNHLRNNCPEMREVRLSLDPPCKCFSLPSLYHYENLINYPMCHCFCFSLWFQLDTRAKRLAKVSQIISLFFYSVYFNPNKAIIILS
ncbi:hypothetical protein BD560DRAFT_415446 [Blakeslea trispora]|nr:hypothetical protein BD560DRAFT_415446 [Blakeslea trispora]